MKNNIITTVSDTTAGYSIPLSGTATNGVSISQCSASAIAQVPSMSNNTLTGSPNPSWAPTTFAMPTGTTTGAWNTAPVHPVLDSSNYKKFRDRVKQLLKKPV